jgi:DNA repair exonuclease SbcCD nuclease subunit
MVKYCEFVCIGDLHLGAFGNIFADMDNPDALVFEAVQQAVDYAKYNGIKTLIFLGDLFDAPEPSQHQVTQLLAFLLTLRDYDVHIITGNHDYEHISHNALEIADFVIRAGMLPHVKLYLKPTQTSIDGVPFCFFPWPHHNRKKFKLTGPPSVNIAHVEQTGALTDSGRKIEEGVKLDQDSGDAWVIGHLHRRQEIGRIFYPGTLFQKTFGEPLPKGFLHGEAELRKGKLKFKGKWQAIQPPFVLENLRIEAPEDLRQVQAYSTTDRPIKRYKLFIKNSVALPPTFRVDNPHVVRIDGWKTKQEAEQLEKGNLVLSPAALSDTKKLIFNDLSTTLKEKGLNKPQRKKARKIINRIAAELKLVEL